MGEIRNTVDALVFRKIDKTLEILLIIRKDEPFKGIYAIPGGIAEKDEVVEVAVARELYEETGLKDIRLVKLGLYDDQDRDPRGRFVSTAFVGFLKSEIIPKPGDDAESVQWFPVSNLPELAFDHENIIKDALEHLKNHPTE